MMMLASSFDAGGRCDLCFVLILVLFFFFATMEGSHYVKFILQVFSNNIVSANSPSNNFLFALMSLYIALQWNELCRTTLGDVML